jgi:hypothetical protein
MNTEQTDSTAEHTAVTPDSASASTEGQSLSDMSLADYRANRSGKATAEETADDNPTEDAGESLGSEEDAPSPEHDGEEEAESTTEEAKPKKKGGFQRKLEAKDKEIEDLRAQLAAKPAEAAGKGAPAPEPQFDKAKPKMDDFDSIEDFTEALTDWKAEEREFKKEQQARIAERQKSETQLIDRWNSGKREYSKSHADYDQAMKAASDIKVSPAHQRILLESENGPELAYALAKDREKLTKFAALAPLQAALFIGKLEASIAKAPATTTKARSSAPAPINPVNSRSASPAGKVDATKIAGMSTADYRKARALRRVS